MDGGSSERSPALAMAMVCVPQISIRRIGPVSWLMSQSSFTRRWIPSGRRNFSSKSIDGLLNAGEVLLRLFFCQLLDGKSGMDHHVVAGF